jgi:hypothetical protein
MDMDLKNGQEHCQLEVKEIDLEQGSGICTQKGWMHLQQLVMRDEECTCSYY